MFPISSNLAIISSCIASLMELAATFRRSSPIYASIRLNGRFPKEDACGRSIIAAKSLRSVPPFPVARIASTRRIFVSYHMLFHLPDGSPSSPWPAKHERTLPVSRYPPGTRSTSGGLPMPSRRLLS